MSRAKERQPIVAWLRGRVPASPARARVERKILASPTYERARTVAQTAADMSGSAPGAYDDGSPAGSGAPPDVIGEIGAAIEAINGNDIAGGIETLKSLVAALQESEARGADGDQGEDGDGVPSADAMVKEGLPPKLAREISDQSKKHPALARNSLSNARARLANNVSPFMPRTPPSGGRAA